MKLNIVKRLQNWMDSIPGQTFLNYAYSWGAAIVILGTLVKPVPVAKKMVTVFINAF